MTRRVVVTGVGLVCALGIGTEESWRNLVAGCSGIAPITQFDTKGFDCTFAGEVKNFDPLRWIEKKELKKMARFIQIALASADFAVKSANWKPEDSNLDEVGVYVSSGIGGFDIIEREHWKLVQGGPGKISPFFIPSAIVNLASGQISIRYGARGPNSATATACSASAHAIGDSFKIIERNAAEMMICGGSEATITPMGIGGFAAMKALSTRNDDPAHASRPWDAGRDGFVVGEGAYRVMMAAIKDAKLSPNDIGYVNAHGTSTPIGDVIETRALKRVFGDRARKVPVSSTKSMTGHLLGGAGGLEAGISVLALRDEILPPTVNHENPDPECDLDYVPNHARKASVEYALSNSFGFGGTNAALIFRRWSGK